jgi:hypothetical protein
VSNPVDKQKKLGEITNIGTIYCDLCDKWTHIRCTTEISEKIYDNMLNGEPVDFICNNCILQQMPQFDIFDSKDLDNNTTQNSTIMHT